MDEVKQWVFTICTGTLLCGMISILSPSKSFEKVIGLILGLFLLICFFTPIRMDAFSFRLEFSEAQNLQNRVAEETDGFFFRAAVEKSQQAIEDNVYKMLEPYGIQPEEIEIYIETMEEHSNRDKKLVVARVRLPSKIRSKHREVYRMLEYGLGIDVQLTYREENL